MSRVLLQGLTFVCLAGFSQMAVAHTGITAGDDLIHGFQHVFLGLDHFLLMLGLGLWASKQSRLLANQTIAVFWLCMAAGILFGWSGFVLAYLELAVLVSVLLMGVALCLPSGKLPRFIILGAFAAFAAIHGLTHGQEMPVAASAYAYFAGILSATALLFFGGWGLGGIAGRTKLDGLIRVYGAMAGIAGAWLLMSA